MLEKKGNPSKLLGKVKANGSISHTQAINEKLTAVLPVRHQEALITTTANQFPGGNPPY